MIRHWKVSVVAAQVVPLTVAMVIITTRFLIMGITVMDIISHVLHVLHALHSTTKNVTSWFVILPANDRDRKIDSSLYAAVPYPYLLLVKKGDEWPQFIRLGLLVSLSCSAFSQNLLLAACLLFI
jgi:hypothetical protein